jgi:hypothetical protein
MQKYASNVQDRAGSAVQGASVMVTDSLGAPATLYAGPASTSGTQANPIITAADGEYAFYAPNGRYSIQITALGFLGDAVADLLLYDPAEPYTPIDATIADSAASAFASKIAAADSATAAAASNAQTALDKIATNADRTQTGLDRAQTGLDAATTAAKAVEAADSAASVVRDGSGGVAGLTGFAINLWNAAKTFKSSLTFSGTANRVHTLQDRNGTLADDTDLASKMAKISNLSDLTDPAAARTNLNLGNINNTSDANKPVSTLQAAAIAARFGKDNILGTVSQTSGVPTGALMEHVTNANGEYWRFAGGLQICSLTISPGSIGMSANGACFISSGTQGGSALPAAFLAGTTPCFESSLRSDQGTAWLTGAVAGSPTNFPQNYLLSSGSATLTNTRIDMLAIGRWF